MYNSFHSIYHDNLLTRPRILLCLTISREIRIVYSDTDSQNINIPFFHFAFYVFRVSTLLQCSKNPYSDYMISIFLQTVRQRLALVEKSIQCRICKLPHALDLGGESGFFLLSLR